MAYSYVSILFFLTITLHFCYGEKLGFDFHHSFSDKVQEWTASQGLPPTWNPEETPRFSVEYYKKLFKNDLHRHRGRFLSDGDLYAFATGNMTMEYLANLHYAFVDIGTPNQTFLVALDTGSHLFWLPCNCEQCAPTSDPSYGNVAFRNYEPDTSSTSKKITCSSDQCFTTSRLQCTNQSADCTYSLTYGSGSSSGTLVQDSLYLIKQDNITPQPVKLSVVFGCAQNQSGDFLKFLAPNGLMGLGLSKIAVPSLIANSGLNISDSFSMCFGEDGYGRLNFGDKGSADQNETTLNINAYPFYNISLTGLSVGSNFSKLSFTAIVDSGTSFSAFTDEIHNELGTSFSAQVSEPPIQFKDIPFEYCFELSANQTRVRVPLISFTTEGGSKFSVLHPAVLLYDTATEKAVAYCLAIMRYDMNIIGENFLVGQRIVFDREKEILGWMPYNCYGSQTTYKAPPAPATVRAPAPATVRAPPAPTTQNVSDVTPPPSPNSALSPHVGLSVVVSVVASVVSLTLMWLPIF